MFSIKSQITKSILQKNAHLSIKRISTFCETKLGIESQRCAGSQVRVIYKTLSYGMCFLWDDGQMRPSIWNEKEGLIPLEVDSTMQG